MNPYNQALASLRRKNTQTGNQAIKPKVKAKQAKKVSKKVRAQVV